MKDFNRNNLDKSSSPYLRQHKDNPINWQEWSTEVLDYAKKHNKPLFVSVGYSTCHWCHVMAREAFSDKEIADFLNESFVSIKIDREERPDIDHFLMSYIIEDQGRGGWPLNVFLTPDVNPFLALTYVPVSPSNYMPGFHDILMIAKEIFKSRRDDIKKFTPSTYSQNTLEKNELVDLLIRSFDNKNSGFGPAPKFPPHNTLLFLLSYYEKTKSEEVKEILVKTLDKMSMRGLHDHLQGGFFRYCTDSEWTVPHFEKMLYDQAMMLWVYSTAYKIFNNDRYKTISEKIIVCLEETFEQDGLYYSAHDADTDHEEGKTYLWSYGELKNILGEDFPKLLEIYDISKEGNLEGLNHLTRKENKFSPELESKLLSVRKKREQPFTDKKIVTSWNALLGIAFIAAYRFLGNEKSRQKAMRLFDALIEKHYINKKLFHTSLENNVQEKEFLEDYASMTLFASYIYEETWDGKHLEFIKKLSEKMNVFRIDGKWYENKTDDFTKVEAQKFDHPIPSSYSLEEFASLRARIILDKDYSDEYTMNYGSDFYNLMMFVAESSHIIKTSERISWRDLPLLCMQLPSVDGKIQDCYEKTCRIFETNEALIKSLVIK